MRQVYDNFSEADKIATGLKPHERKYDKWETRIPSIIDFANEQKSFLIKDLVKAGVVPKGTTGQTMRKCVMPKLVAQGFSLIEKKRGAGRAAIYHLPNHEVVETPKEKEIFTDTTAEGFTKAAAFVANNLLPSHSNGAYLDLKKHIPKKTLPFMKNGGDTKKFLPYLQNAAQLKGWTFAGTPYKAKKEEDTND